MPGHPRLSLRRQCELIGLPRSSGSSEPARASAENLTLMRLIDEQYTPTPFYDSRRRTVTLSALGVGVNRKRVQRLMRLMGLEGVAPGPRTPRPHPQHTVYPCLLRGRQAYRLRDVMVVLPNPVWSTDSTDIPRRHGFMYRVAILEGYRRYVLAWALSNTPATGFCVAALERALAQARPEMFNTDLSACNAQADQGVQFTRTALTDWLKTHGVQISRDGRGRVFDNLFVERLWRTVKHEDIDLKDDVTVAELEVGLAHYFQFYNHERPHQALGYRAPAAVYAQP